SSGCTCTESFSAGNSSFTSSGNSPPSSVATEASVRPANGPVSTTHCGPVNQASPTSSVVPVSAYHGRKSLFPHGRSLNQGFNRNGATLVVIIVLFGLLSLLQQHRRNRPLAHSVLPQNNVQLLRIRVVLMGKVHLGTLARPRSLPVVGRIDQPVL